MYAYIYIYESLTGPSAPPRNNFLVTCLLKTITHLLLFYSFAFWSNARVLFLFIIFFFMKYDVAKSEHVCIIGAELSLGRKPKGVDMANINFLRIGHFGGK